MDDAHGAHSHHRFFCEGGALLRKNGNVRAARRDVESGHNSRMVTSQ